MQETPITLTDEEAMALDVFRVRLVSKGMGLTYEILSSELKSYPGFGLDAALESLVAKGLLANPHFYKKIYILTAEGKQYIIEHLETF